MAQPARRSARQGTLWPGSRPVATTLTLVLVAGRSAVCLKRESGQAPEGRMGFSPFPTSLISSRERWWHQGTSHS